MSKRQELIDLLSDKSGKNPMNRSDASAFVGAIYDLKKLAEEKFKIVSVMTASTREYYGDKTDRMVHLIMEVIDDIHFKL